MIAIRHLMTADPVTLAPTDTLRFAAGVLSSIGAGGAPVTQGSRVVGIVTMTDILDFAAHHPSPSGSPPAERDAAPGGSVDGAARMNELLCDGVLVATPAGSTAYNFSAHGPILPINSRLLALTPISAFRPRRWRGALLPHRAQVRIEVLEADRRGVSAAADNAEIRDVVAVDIREDTSAAVPLLFDPGHALDERIVAEQFMV